MTQQRFAIAWFLVALIAPLRASADGERTAPAQNDALVPEEVVEVHHGQASWYGPRHHGRRTASGEPFDCEELTAAHPTLPFGTRVRVTNRINGRAVTVRVNDRGGFRRGRAIDLSQAAARELGMIARGTAPVALEILR
jgi:rare lipoprotein A